jgi:hypothetical protein
MLSTKSLKKNGERVSVGHFRLLAPSLLALHENVVLQDGGSAKKETFLEPILRLLNVQLQRQRCSRLERFSKYIF